MSPRIEAKPERIIDINTLVLRVLKEAGNPLMLSEIVKLVGSPEKEVSLAIKQLLAQGKTHSPKPGVYGIIDIES